MTLQLHPRHVDAPDILDIGEEGVIALVRTIKLGWDRVLEHGVRAGTQEVELNELLRDGMRQEVNERAGDEGPEIIVWSGAESRSTPDILIPDGRSDIPVQFVFIVAEHHDHEPHAIIECKRVSGSDARLCRLYVVEGIDRFKDGKYAVRHALGFMAGYLESGDAALAARGINRYLESEGRDAERLRAGTVVQAEWTRHSRHSRQGAHREIVLHHVFLAFRVGRS